MATSKSGSSKTTKKSTAKKPTRSSETKVTKVTAGEEKAAPATTSTAPKFFTRQQGSDISYPAIIIAEVIGTFVLTLVVLAATQATGALYVGLAVAVLVLAVGAISGAHLNPAVTFGLWAARRLKSVLLPVYWLAQFVGAILAVLVLGAFTGTGFPLDFSHFASFSWSIVGVELLGTAVFLFGLIATLSNDKLSNVGKAFGVGLALTIGILVSGAAVTTLQGAKYNSYLKEAQNMTKQGDKPAELPRELYVKGATLNPAVALAVTENTQSQLSGSSATDDEAKYSRLSLEVIVGTLIGAALGANLYLLLAYVNRQQ